MAEVKPAEVSAILKNQLSGYESTASLDEVGSVLTVGDGIARVYGLSNVQYGELVEFDNGLEGIVLNLEEDNVGVVLLGHSKSIVEGSTVKRTQRIASINVGEGISGRVVNTLGEPIDGKGAITGKTYEMPLERIAPGVIFREPVTEPLQTGIKAIDAMIPVGRGQRELVIGDRQTGKTTVCIDTILNQKEFYDAGEPVYCIYVAIGQKASTVAASYLIKYGKLSLDDAINSMVTKLELEDHKAFSYNNEVEFEDYLNSLIQGMVPTQIQGLLNEISGLNRMFLSEKERYIVAYCFDCGLRNFE